MKTWWLDKKYDKRADADKMLTNNDVIWSSHVCEY